jgi:hypothetical protein
MEPNEERRCWWTILRRSHGIPDLVTDRHAGIAIVDHLASKYPTGLLGERLVFRSVIEAILTLGSRGELDDYLVPSALASSIRQEPDLPCLEVRVRNVEPTVWSNFRTDKTRAAIISASSDLAQTIGNYIRRVNPPGTD